MTVLRLAELTWREIEELQGERAVVLLPVGAVEAHGPHLPLGTDVIIAEAMAEAAGRRLAASDLVPCLLPPLSYTAAPFAAAFAGTIDVPPKAVHSAVVAVGRALGAHGVRHLAIANAHLDPTHLTSLHDAKEQVIAEFNLLVTFPDLTDRRWANRLGDEFESGACHAGRYEGSIVMAQRPELVHEEIARDLEPNPRSLSEAIRAGQTTFEEAGGSEAYFGDPAAATAEEGRERIEELGRILFEAVIESADIPVS